jgi:hypothetical protein
VFVVKNLKSHTGSLVCLHLFCIGVEIDVGRYKPLIDATGEQDAGEKI